MSGTKISLAPNFLSDLHDQLELRPLLIFRKDIALFGGSEATLRRQTKLLQRQELCGLIDTTLDIILRFQPARLRRDKTQHNRLALRYETQRFEPTGTVAVVFQEIPVQV